MANKLIAAGWTRLSANVFSKNGYTLLTTTGVCVSPIGTRRTVAL